MWGAILSWLSNLGSSAGGSSLLSKVGAGALANSGVGDTASGLMNIVDNGFNMVGLKQLAKGVDTMSANNQAQIANGQAPDMSNIPTPQSNPYTDLYMQYGGGRYGRY